jgi:hypothetical protein
MARVTWTLSVAFLVGLVLTACQGHDAEKRARQIATVPVIDTVVAQERTPSPTSARYVSPAPTWVDMPEATALSPTPLPSPSPTPIPLSAPAPSRVTFPPGAPIDLKRGVAFVDPRTGAVEAWALPEGSLTAGMVSPGGRYVAYAVVVGRQPFAGSSIGVTRTLLLDTRTSTYWELPGWVHAFSRDESRLLVVPWGRPSGTPERILVVRTDTGAIEREIVLDNYGVPSSFGYSYNTSPSGAFSPDGEHAFIWFAHYERTDSGWRQAGSRLLKVNLRSGAVTTSTVGQLPHLVWSRDGQRYLLTTTDAIQVRRTVDDAVLWSVRAEDILISSVPSRISPQHPDRSFHFTSLSADGRLAAVSAFVPHTTPDSAARMYVLDVETGEVRFWIEGALHCDRLAWTADSHWLTVLGHKGEQRGSFLIAADGSVIRYFSELAYPSLADGAIAGTIDWSATRRAVQVLNVPDGTVRLSVLFQNPPVWDWLHDPLWLPDGRAVIRSSPDDAHDGCALGQFAAPELAVVFPAKQR